MPMHSVCWTSLSLLMALEKKTNSPEKEGSLPTEASASHFNSSPSWDLQTAGLLQIDFLSHMAKSTK